MRSFLGAAFLLSLSLICGCESGSEAEPKGGDDAGTAAVGPRYVVASQIDNPEGRSTYFSVTKSLGVDTRLDFRNALEVVGHATLYGSDRLGWFAVGGAESPSITRFDLNDDDELVKRDTMSLDDFGIAWMGFNASFLDEHKAYYLEYSSTYQVIVWDPSEMTITRSIELPSLLPVGDEVLGSATMTLRGDQLLIFAAYTTDDTVRTSSMFVIIDTATDEVVSSTVVEGCANATQLVRVPNGDIYISSGADASLYHRGDESGSPACLLRLPAGASELDDKRFLLADWTGSKVTAGAFPGPDGSLILQAYDESVEPLPEDPGEAYGTAAWRLWRWKPGQEDAELLDGEPLALKDGWAVTVEGSAYVNECEDDDCGLVETTADGIPRRLRSSGYVSNIVRVR